MRKFWFTGLVSALLAALLLMASGPVNADPAAQPVKIEKKVRAEKDVPQYLQDISVTIRAEAPNGGAAEGSGTLKITKDGQVWIWTCGHVVKHARTTRHSDDGKTLVEFGNVEIVKVLTEDGRKVGEMRFDAEVIRYSDADFGEDLALLRLRTKAYKPPQGVEFYLDDKFPPIGTKLLHCGSLLGQFGSTSVTNGIVSQVGRILFRDTVFDQTNAASWPGSSGGGEYLEADGRYVGMLVRGAGETFCFYVPVRRIQTWAKKTGVEFAMDDKLPVPTDAELKKKPIDDSLAAVLAAAQAEKPIPKVNGLPVITRQGDYKPMRYLVGEPPTNK